MTEDQQIIQQHIHHDRTAAGIHGKLHLTGAAQDGGAPRCGRHSGLQHVDAHDQLHGQQAQDKTQPAIDQRLQQAVGAFLLPQQLQQLTLLRVAAGALVQDIQLSMSRNMVLRMQFISKT